MAEPCSFPGCKPGRPCNRCIRRRGRARADVLKRTCSPCLRGHHTLCTSTVSCAHARCDLDVDDMEETGL